MRILNICMGAPFTEGYTYQDNLLSEYQVKLGHEVTVLTTTRTRDANGHITEVAPEDKLLANGVRLVRLRAPGRLQQFLGLYRGLNQAIERLSPQFIFVHGLGSFVTQAAIRYKQKHTEVKIVADNHQDKGTTYTDHFPFNLQLWFFRYKWHSWVHSVEKVYGTTSWRKTFARIYYGIPEEKLDTLIMGIDSDHLPIDHMLVRRAIREELGIPQDAFLFVTGGKLDHHKHTLEAMKAFGNQPGDNARFLLFGAVLPEIKEEFDTLLNNDSRMKYIGYVKSQEVHKYFLAADFGLFPGRHSVLWEEAIGCGLPCLFHKYEEHDHTEICENCIRMTSHDEKDIQAVLERVLDNKAFYEKLKRQSLLAAKEYSYHTIAKKSLECAN